MIHGVMAFAANIVAYALLARAFSKGNRFVLFLLCGATGGSLLIGYGFWLAPSTAIERFQASSSTPACVIFSSC